MLATDNTVLLVIDIQARLMPSIHNHEALERKAAACIAGCKLLDIPIIVLQQYTKGLGETVPALQAAIGDFEPVEKITFSACHSPEFMDKLTRVAGAGSSKCEHDFNSSMERPAQAGKTNIIITGIEAHICVQLTVLDLLAAGYNVFVAADCIGSRNEADRMYAEERMRQAGAVITTLESVLFELLVRADHPMRKEITKLVVAVG